MIPDKKPRTPRFTMIAKTLAGLEDVLATELEELGAGTVEKLTRGVSFTGDLEMLYKANLWCRTALKILKPVGGFRATHESVLYKNVADMPWEDFLGVDQTLAVEAVVLNSRLRHSHYAALKAKDAIVDRFRNKYGRRPNVNTVNPHVRVHLHISNDFCTVSLDSSGEVLYKRGYRKYSGLAPMNEVLAAGLILLSGWNKEGHFVDPMCGSATLPVEAALYACNIAPGRFRRQFAFERWPGVDDALWARIKEEADAARQDFGYEIIGADFSGFTLNRAKENLVSAGVDNVVRLKASHIEDFVPPYGRGVVVTNPPYGQRVKTDDLHRLYKTMGDTLKSRYNGYSAWVISADAEAVKHIGLHASKKLQVYNGELKCSYLRFDVYEGSKKSRTAIEPD
jgi:putative N6-adenine-specific DNA methylase